MRYGQFKWEAEVLGQKRPSIREWLHSQRHSITARIKHRLGLRCYKLIQPDDGTRFKRCTWCGHTSRMDPR